MSRYAVIILAFLLFACDDTSYIPKPSTYLRLTYPERDSQVYEDSCGFSFEIPSYFEVKGKVNNCNKDINLKGLNGTLFYSFIPMKEELYKYINYSISKVDEHKLKATSIKDTNILNPTDGVYGTYFFLEGNVAKPIQFHMTDSVNYFVNGYLMFEAVPNYDSIKPILEYVGDDIIKMMQTTKF